MDRQFSTDESRGVIFEPLEVENMSLLLASVASLVESEILVVESRSPEVEYCSRMELSEPGEVEYVSQSRPMSSGW
jgi:hypothetical protein